MKLQHMLAMAEGYTAFSDHQGELDFFFRHQMDANRLVFLKVTLVREKDKSWTILAEAQDGEKLYEDGACVNNVSDGVAEIVRRSPDWCKV